MNQRGAILLETIVALAILATVGGTGAWMVSESVRAITSAHEQEARVRAAGRFLSAVSLWPRDDLDRHLGWTAQGPWRLRIDRTRATLYVVSLADTSTGRVLLATALFRGDLEP